MRLGAPPSRVTPACGLWLWALTLGGCAVFSPTTIATKLDVAGWFQADAALTWQKVGPRTDCQALAERVGQGEVIVLVHGVKGDGDELRSAERALWDSRPGALFLFRWVPWADREAIVQQFAAGLSTLLRCLPAADGHLLVLAHSAGGLVASYGATRLVVPDRQRRGPALYLLTVASPLAGTEEREGNSGGQPEARFMLDLGSRITRYPVAPTAMSVVHLRTQYPADQVMKPTGAHLPNDPSVGVPGAPQIDLPSSLSHDAALTWVAERVADGRWRQWFSAPWSARSD